MSNELTNTEIINICNKHNISINGIYCKDQLPKILIKGWYIINLDDAKGGGTHWCCFHYGKENLYFDSYGFPSPQQVEDKITPYVYNHKQIQNIDASTCGYYCIACIKCCERGTLIEFNKFINYFSKDTTINDRILQIILFR